MSYGSFVHNGLQCFVLIQFLYNFYHYRITSPGEVLLNSPFCWRRAISRWTAPVAKQVNGHKDCFAFKTPFLKFLLTLDSHNFPPLEVDRSKLPDTDCAKIPGVTIFSDLKWNNHIVFCIKKANKHLYFIALLKRAHVPRNDIVNFYSTTIRLLLECCAPVFHHTFPAYLNEDIERILYLFFSFTT